MRLLLWISFALALTSCSRHSFMASEIDRIDYKVADNKPVNHGSTVVLELTAIDNEGKSHRLEHNDQLAIHSTEMWEYQNTGFIVDHPASSFADTFYTFDVTYSDTSGTFSQHDSLWLDYKDPVHAFAPISVDQPGENRRSRSATLFGRDGVNGEKGGHGANGKNGPDCTGYLWREGNELRLRLEIDSLNEVWAYKSFVTDTVTISLNGTRGSRGGKGGDGGNGKDAYETKAAGNGGDGGAGGDGGNGGNGGSILLFVHSNVSELENKITIYNSGASGGSGGAGGQGGSAGSELNPTDPNTAKDGIPGVPGIRGNDGKSGPEPVLIISTFDYKRFG